MWRKIFHAVICWLTLSKIPAAIGKIVDNSIVKDNDSVESAPRLYRNVPYGVYASASPYAAYSFHLPAFVAAPKAAASRIIPVKEQLVLHNVNGYLRDSYGNKFVDTPQSAAYKTAFPQQFLPLQELPEHLSQPLLAAPKQQKQAAPHYFVGSQYRLPTFQVGSHNPSSSFGGFSQPLVFTQNFGAAPSQAVPTHAQTVPTHTQAITVQQQPSSNKAAYTNSQSVDHYKNPYNEVKFQRLEHRPEVHHAQSASGQQPYDNKAEIQAAPAKTSVTAIVNGKQTVITLDTQPPVPLLDLSLLEPLTFANPLVPQVQHFLPRISQATYHRLPEYNVNEQNKHNNEIIVQRTKSYDNGNVKSKQRKDAPKKKPKQSSVQSDNHHQPRPDIHDTSDENPEFSYQNKSPNYIETINEKSISYNNLKESDPVSYSYDKKTEAEPVTYSYQKIEQKEPVTYNFVHNSKEPIKQVLIKQANHQGHGQEPKHLIYTFKPEEKHRENKHVESDDAGSAEDAGSSEESDDDAPAPAYHNSRNYHNNREHHNKAPRSEYNQEYHHRPQGPNPEHNQGPNPEHNQGPNPQHHQGPNPHHLQGPNPHHLQGPIPHYHGHNQGTRHHKSNDVISHRSNGNLQHVPNEEKHPDAPQQNSQQAEGPVDNTEDYPPQEYEEHIRIDPSQTPNKEFLKQIDSYQNPLPSPLSTLEQYQKFVEQQVQARTDSTSQQPYSSAAPIVHEKTKRIIIQEETPEDMHSHVEQMKAEMIDQEDNNEEDFEKAYKNAAYGFAAFDNKAKDIEKDIYSPNTYSFADDHANFEVEKTPFQKYQVEGDSFPKSSRASYKDARDSLKDDYYLEYSVNKPDSLADRYQNKANYFKLYKSHKPEKYFAADQDKKKSEKYTVAPSFTYGPAPKKKQNYFAQYKVAPVKYEYNFGKEKPRNNSAHASRAYQRLKSKTNFVEPQFQYGFEPIGLPRLLDSELAAMASNLRPESEKPGMRKKIYKENWYIKKTRTSGGKPS